MTWRLFTILFLLSALCFVQRTETRSQTPEPDADHAERMTRSRELFKREVRQVFAGRCVKCHGGENTEGEFSLASREELLEGGAGGMAIDLKEPSASYLLKLINHQEEPVMPEDGAKLDQRQIDAIAQWISLGAAYDKPLSVEVDEDPSAWTKRTIDDSARDFWSFQPLHYVVPREVGDDAWPRTVIDDFVQQKFVAAGVIPNAIASRRKLLRRAYFDLIGLPPTKEEAEAFINDPDPQAYEKLLDRLLDSEHHGERVGRHWLDIARFAESHGFEQDYDRPHAYHYRDFVIQAFNADMPFDQFVRWQIAGDELEPGNPLAMMATGFLGAGVFPTQLTEKEFESSRYDELDDMVATLGTAMLGITVGCARCHDHKFDPIPARDYYQLVSAFRTAIRSNIEIDLDPQATVAASEKWKSGLKPLRAALSEFEEKVLPSRFASFLQQLQDNPESIAEMVVAPWIGLVATSVRSEKGAAFVVKEDGSYLVTGKNANFDVYTFESATSLPSITALRLEALADDSMTKRGPGRAGNGNFGLSRITVAVQSLSGSDEPVEVALLDPQVTFEQNAANLSIAGSLDDDPKTGWAVDPKFGQDHAATFRFEKPVEHAAGTRFTVRLEFNVNSRHNFGRFRIAVSSQQDRPALDAPSISQPDAELQTLKLVDGRELTEAQRHSLLGIYKKTDGDWRSLNDALQTHLSNQPQPKLTRVMITSEGVKPIPNHGDGRGFPHFYKESYFLNRGDVNQKQGVAPAGFLQVLMRSDSQAKWETAPPANASTSHRRQAVADWITDTEQGAGHLLARVIVNRIWQQHLGRGIVATTNDFGFQGERPTHPELLDWLASELIRNGWRLKPIRKLIMSSSVYMQDSRFMEPGAQADPDNRMFWRFSPRRLESEIIRDSMLAVSGDLDRTRFGAGTLDENMRRRSIYFMIKRSKLIPFLQVFDTPEPLASVGNRPSTTIAPQALIFMNNPRVRHYAQSFAKKIANDDVAESIGNAYMEAIARSPTEDELAGSMRFVARQTASYRSESKPNAGELALTDLCQVLMSLSEFVYID